jgi:hypothetical protein
MAEITNCCSGLCSGKSTIHLVCRSTLQSKQVVKLMFLSDPNQLFRLNSMASKMLTAYARQNGPSYLKDTLGGHLTRIVKENKAYEV